MLGAIIAVSILVRNFEAIVGLFSSPARSLNRLSSFRLPHGFIPSWAPG